MQTMDALKTGLTGFGKGSIIRNTLFLDYLSFIKNKLCTGEALGIERR